MKKSIIFILWLVSYHFSFAQNITGSWFGTLEIQNTRLPLVFHIQQRDTTYIATMDSPAQGAKGIVVNSTTVQDSLLTCVIKNIGARYQGSIKNDTLIIGTFMQAGQKFSLQLKKGEKEKVTRKPQEPVPPYPYTNEEISFTNKIGDTLAGTLSLPRGTTKKASAVILISGSGPQNRDSEIVGHKPFLVISDYLVRKGIVVLRFDERGVGASKGNFDIATTQDFADDVESAYNYLLARSEIDTTKIGLVGHSEGGLIASMVASQHQKVNFVVLLATPGIRGDKVLLSQSEKILEKSNITKDKIDTLIIINKSIYNLITKHKDQAFLKSELTRHITNSVTHLDVFNQKPDHLSEQDYINAMVTQLSSPWFTFFVRYDPKMSIQKMKCPVLVLQGENDVQVLPDENLKAIEAAFNMGNHNMFDIVTLPELNHLFQHSKTGLPREYMNIEETFAPNALQIMGNWLDKTITH